MKKQDILKTTDTNPEALFAIKNDNLYISITGFVTHDGVTYANGNTYVYRRGEDQVTLVGRDQDFLLNQISHLAWTYKKDYLADARAKPEAIEADIARITQARQTSETNARTLRDILEVIEGLTVRHSANGDFSFYATDEAVATLIAQLLNK